MAHYLKSRYLLTKDINEIVKGLDFTDYQNNRRWIQVGYLMVDEEKKKLFRIEMSRNKENAKNASPDLTYIDEPKGIHKQFEIRMYEGFQYLESCDIKMDYIEYLVYDPISKVSTWIEAYPDGTAIAYYISSDDYRSTPAIPNWIGEDVNDDPYYSKQNIIKRLSGN